MKTCALIPTYNNVGTIRDIVQRTLQYLPLIVVADGPTDGTLEVLQELQEENLTIIAYPENKGKGYALKCGLLKAKELGYTHVLTLDSDGQHFPEDIPAMLRLSAIRPEAIIIGQRELVQENMPRKNTFANRFSNFWFTIQTGIPLPDTQTGFRIYPLNNLHGLHFMTHRYEAELLLLVLSAWANTPILSVPVKIYYPPKNERISFFHPSKDFLRISLLNTILCIVALIYGLPRRYWRTIYYGFLTLLFSFISNLTRIAYTITHPKNKTEQLHKILVHIARCFLSLFPTCSYKVSTAPNADPLDPTIPCIFIANHNSLLDILALITIHDHVVAVGKEWVLHNIIFGEIAKAIGFISIDNGADNIRDTIQNYVQKQYSIAIFPEGTRSLTGEIARFHQGAFYIAEELQLPIRPILIQGTALALPKLNFHVGNPKEISVTILPSIQPNDPTYGTNYRERTRLIRNYYKHLIDQSTL